MKKATHFHTDFYMNKNLQQNRIDTFPDEIGETKEFHDKNSCEGKMTLEDR